MYTFRWNRPYVHDEALWDYGEKRYIKAVVSLYYYELI